MIGCAAAASLIELRLDGAATPEELRALDVHLATCPACAALFEAETAIDAALAARFSRVEAPAGLAADIRRRVDAEAPIPASAAWVADALNAVGFLVAVATAAGIAAALGVGLAGAAVGVALAALAAGYPLVLSGLAGETGPGESGPALPVPRI